MKTANERIAEFFKKYRISSNHSLEEVVRLAELGSIVELEEYESGARKIPLDVCFALLNLYNTPPDEVLELFYEVAHAIAADRKKSRTSGQELD